MPPNKSSALHSSLLILLLTLSWGAPSLLADCIEDLLPAAYTHVAVRNGGDWGAPNTWDAGIVPGTNSVVKIPAAYTVTIESPFPAKLSKVVIFGTLKFKANGYGELNLDTLLIPSFINKVTSK